MNDERYPLPAPGPADNRLKNCPSCRLAVPRTTLTCARCGYVFRNWAAFRPAPPPRPEGQNLPPLMPTGVREVAPAPHDISTAVMISCIIPGGGQFYNHQWVKGVLMTGMPLVFFGFLGFNWLSAYLGLMIYAASICDAASIANRIIEGESVGQWRWF